MSAAMLAVVSIIVLGFGRGLEHYPWNAGRIIDDNVFYDTNVC